MTGPRAAVARLFEDCRADPALLSRYEGKPLPDLVLQARCDGYAFAPADLSGMIGEMEVWMIVTIAGEPIDASSNLWRKMWGRSRLDYVVRELWVGLDEPTRMRISSSEGVAA
jgi:hypothetical protein